MSNQSYVQKGKLAFLSLFALAIGGLISCSSPVDSILKDVPTLEAGNQTLTVTVSRSNGEALDSFELTIDGETATYETAEVVISDVTSKTYTVAVSKEGFIGKSKDITLAVPTDESTDFEADLSLILTKVNDPTPVSSTGATISVPAIGNGQAGAGSSATEVSIPAGAIPAGTSLDISITPIPVEADEENDTEGVKTVSYQFEPAGTEFAEPITITIPLDLTQAQIDANLPVQFEYPASNPPEIVPVTVSADGKTGTVQIDHFSIWSVAFDMIISETLDTRTRSVSSECSGALSEVVTFTGSYSNLYLDLYGLEVNVTKNINVNQAAAPLFITTGTASVGVFNYTITSSNGTVLERATNIPIGATSVTYAFVECHDSGG